MKIVAIVGSLRKGSYNLQLARTIQERYKDKFELEVADIRSLPYFDQDEENNPSNAVIDYKKKVSQADGVLIITPEYNWSIPGVLKNALDWLSRVDKVMIGKPVMITGVTPGMLGTIRAQLHLREILASPGIQAKLLPPAANEVVINAAGQKFDEATGRLTDEPTLQFVDGAVDRFISFIRH
ncbi:NADPH-dependent FMN reductase [Cohnella sp.]|uniref:NADPH-dependent FMN reductase n=1 Tax=Cohnella sp. TaxID=1883426 RepID=UPI0035660665